MTEQSSRANIVNETEGLDLASDQTWDYEQLRLSSHTACNI